MFDLNVLWEYVYLNIRKRTSSKHTTDTHTHTSTLMKLIYKHTQNFICKDESIHETYCVPFEKHNRNLFKNTYTHISILKHTNTMVI